MFPSSNDACEVRGQRDPVSRRDPLAPLGDEILAEAGDECRRLQRAEPCPAAAPGADDALSRRRAGADAGGMRPEPGRRAGPVHLGPAHRPGRAVSGRRVSARDAGRQSSSAPDVQFEPATAHLAPGQRETWPLPWAGSPGNGWTSGTCRARRRTPTTMCSWASCRGHFSVTNARLGLAVSLDWDAEFFRYGGCGCPTAAPTRRR